MQRGRGSAPAIHASSPFPFLEDMATKGARLRVIRFQFTSRTGTESLRSARWGLVLLLGAVLVHFNGCASEPRIKSSLVEESSFEESRPKTSGPEIPAGIPMSTEEKWGVEAVAVRVTAAGSLLDFRYRVVDPEKASVLFDRRVKPYLVDQTSGARLSVPNMPKLGSLRAKGKVEADRVYFILFGNSGGLVKRGSRVSVVVGDVKLEDLVVE
jgi:hypothetical protein